MHLALVETLSEKKKRSFTKKEEKFEKCANREGFLSTQRGAHIFPPFCLLFIFPLFFFDPESRAKEQKVRCINATKKKQENSHICTELRPEQGEKSSLNVLSFFG